MAMNGQPSANESETLCGHPACVSQCGPRAALCIVNLENQSVATRSGGRC